MEIVSPASLIVRIRVNCPQPPNEGSQCHVRTQTEACTLRCATAQDYRWCLDRELKLSKSNFDIFEGFGYSHTVTFRVGSEGSGMGLPADRAASIHAAIAS